MIRTIFLLHVADHLATPRFAEVDIEVSIDTRSGLRKRSNSKPSCNGSDRDGERQATTNLRPNRARPTGMS